MIYLAEKAGQLLLTDAKSAKVRDFVLVDVPRVALAR